MEDYNFKKGIEDIKNIKLSSKDKSYILERIISRTGENFELQKKVPVRSEWYSSLEVFISSKIWYASATLVASFLFGVTAFSLAQKSLPGDELYSLKVDVIEPLKYATAFGSIAKANVEAENITNRLLEVEALSVQDRLSDSSGNELEDRLKNHIDSFNTLVSSPESSSTEETIDARVNFEAVISAHSRILDKIGQNIKSVSKRLNTSKIKDIIASEVKKVSEGRQNAENSRQNNASTTDSRVFNSKKKSTETIIKKTKNNLEKNIKSSAPISNQILNDTKDSMKRAEVFLEDAKISNDSGDEDRAFQNLLNSRRSAIEAAASLDAGVNLTND